ncbi:hypothetical protein V2J09_004315 [Rumex salicifolius]
MRNKVCVAGVLVTTYANVTEDPPELSPAPLSPQTSSQVPIQVLGMAKIGKARQLKSLYKKHHAHLYQKSSLSHKIAKKTKHCTTGVKNDWQDATCSVCMESPHNAVLLLCSSYKNGCRPYMCATSYRFSNCLDQYKKAYTKLASFQGPQASSEALVPGHGKEEVPQLSCPICRGQVKGWTLVEDARKDLNKNKRNCMQDNCSFVGSYKQLRKHVKAEHPLSRPRDVDPAHEEKWNTLESERERNDVISAITSSDPGAIVLGDFVIEGAHNHHHHHHHHHPLFRNYEEVGGFLDDNYFRIDPFLNNRSFRNRLGFISDMGMERLRNLYVDDDDDEDDDDDDDIGTRAPAGDDNTLPASRQHRRLLFGTINRRSRNRES